ncbi:MAG TPA: Plug domain-containing protein, partial [Thermoanaerobaculaceae bacterium]|nr:Plug domain-containing protein [Thermoanaerobaculaceae bacterium]
MKRDRHHLNLRHHWLRWVALGVVLLTIGIWSQAAEPENQQATQETQQPKQDQSKPATEAPAGRFTQEVKVVAPPIVEGDRVTPFATQVSSVSDRQVDDLNAGDLANALRRMPGVTISRYELVGSYGGGDGGAVYV